RDRLRHGEIARVGDAYRAAGRLGRLLRHHMPRVRLPRLLGRGWRRVLAQRRRHFTREYVTSVPDVGRERVEGGFVDTKVFGQDLPRRVGEPVADQECLVLREVAIIKHQQELDPVLESLDRMRQAGGEVPKVAGADVVDKETALLVKERDAAAAFDHVSPLGFLVPVQLADAAGFKAHVYTSDLRADRQLACRRLASPAAGKDAV